MNGGFGPEAKIEYSFAKVIVGSERTFAAD